MKLFTLFTIFCCAASISLTQDEDCSQLEYLENTQVELCTGASWSTDAFTEEADVYAWYYEGVMLAESSDLDFTPETAGDYTVELIRENDMCSVVTEFTISVNDLPNPDIEHTGLQFCEGGSTTLSTESDYQIVWVKGGQFFSLNPEISVEEGGYYTAVNVSGECISSSSGASVIVHPFPVAEIASSGADFCEGQYVMLQSTDEQSQASWSLNGVEYSTNESTQTSTEGLYTLVAFNDYCQSEPDSLVLISHGFPEVPQLTFEDGILFSSEQEGVTYKWYANNSLMAETEMPFFTPTVSGNYYVQTENEFGCASSSSNLDVVGVEERIAEFIFAVFPNPSNGNFQLNADYDARITSLRLFDTTGKEITLYINEEATNQYKITMSNSLKGLYLLEVTAEDGSRALEKILIN